MTLLNWRSYESAVADLLGRLGMNTEMGEAVTGARATHKVDVTARLDTSGIRQLWLAECKLWRRPVTKEKILAFREIVSDVGADRGIIFAERGFQAGAVNAATNTNITLTSLEEFEEQTAEEQRTLRIRHLENRTELVLKSLMSLTERDGPNRTKLLGGEQHLPTLGRISLLETVLKEVRLGSTRYYLPVAGEDVPVRADDWRDFEQKAEEILNAAEEFVKEAS